MKSSIADKLIHREQNIFKAGDAVAVTQNWKGAHVTRGEELYLDHVESVDVKKNEIHLCTTTDVFQLDGTRKTGIRDMLSRFTYSISVRG
jgi:hypothetical protein